MCVLVSEDQWMLTVMCEGVAGQVSSGDLINSPYFILLKGCWQEYHLSKKTELHYHPNFVVH